MYHERFIVQLRGRDEDAYVRASQRWVRASRGTLLCANCDKRNPNVYPKPIDIQLDEIPSGTFYDGVFPGGAGIIHTGLLQEIQPKLPDYVLGQCMWGNGTIVHVYRTIYFRESIRHFRAGRTGRYYVCLECGFIGGWGEDPYVLRSDIPSGGVFQESARRGEAGR